MKKYKIMDCGNLAVDSDEGKYAKDLHWGIWNREEKSWVGYYSQPAHPGAGMVVFGTIKEAKQYIQEEL